MAFEYSVLFVCLGNICRSPLGEGIFRHLVEQRQLGSKFLIDSCGTGGYHIGSLPHEQSRRVALAHGIDLDGQRARKFSPSDFERFKTIIAMDRENQRDILRLRGAVKQKIYCLREFDPRQDSLDVPDPYWGGPDGFDAVFDIIYRSCECLLDHLVDDHA